MEQYFSIRKQYPDTLLFFQVGDFYELFFDDAKQASSFLAIALTKRGKNKGQDVPLCGVPVHALNHYLQKLIKGGFKVAICDQLSKPQPGTVVERGVTQVFTPGTLTDSTMLDEKSASYLFSFYPGSDEWGLIFTELLTAQLFATVIPSGQYRMMEAELSRFFPDEVLLPPEALGRTFASYFKKLGYCSSYSLQQEQQDDHAGKPLCKAWVEAQLSSHTIKQLNQQPIIEHTLALLYYYLKKTQEKALSQIKAIQFYQSDDYLLLDAATLKNLEIVKNNQDGSRKNTLFAVIDYAKTAMGSRMLRKWLLRPLCKKETILQRQELVGVLYKNIAIIQQLEELLHQLADLERIIGRIALQRAQLNDYLALKESLTITPSIKDIVASFAHIPLAAAIQDKIKDFFELTEFLSCSLNHDATNGHIIKNGFDFHLDRLRDLVGNSQQEISKLEKKEVQRTRITSLKIRFNQVVGYYIEVTKPNLHLVPDDFIHQQTLSNRKRFTTPALKDLERDITKAQNEINVVEEQVYQKVKAEVERHLHPLRHLAQALTYLDAILGLALVAYHNRYIAPTFNDHQDIIISGGRHPVIETALSEQFIKNNTELTAAQTLLIITGPNMGGKSTYLRQVALICLLAQCGSFVPADTADLAILDRIFTRIGAGDNLAEGKSTFLIEMEETATICTQATAKSLVILDEVGRGTSTYDGIALAQAIIEHIVTNIKAKCLFATSIPKLR